MDVLYASDTYDLVVGSDEKENSIYQVINRLTGVIEYDDYILPRSLDAMENLEERYQEADAAYRKRIAQLGLSLVKGEDDNEGSVH